jgi:flagellar motility protein MotE (MotC chaperone)
MKKVIIVIQIVVILLFLAKISVVGGFMQKLEQAGSYLTSLALAQPTGKTADRPLVREAGTDPLQKERDLVSALQKRNADLDKREAAIKGEEQKLATLKAEITGKIDVLKKLEDQLTAKLEADKTSTNKKYKDLAKVYEATPPDKAGAMMERMDIPTAAAITMNMKRDKAGIMWGYINPTKAVEITREITRWGKFVPEEKPAAPAQ